MGRRSSGASDGSTRWLARCSLLPRHGRLIRNRQDGNHLSVEPIPDPQVCLASPSCIRGARPELDFRVDRPRQSCRVGERADASGECDSSCRAARQSKVRSRASKPRSQLDDSGCHGQGPSPLSSHRRYAAVVVSSRNSPRSASSREARRSAKCSAGGPSGCPVAAFFSTDMAGVYLRSSPCHEIGEHGRRRRARRRLGVMRRSAEHHPQRNAWIVRVTPRVVVVYFRNAPERRETPSAYLAKVDGEGSNPFSRSACEMRRASNVPSSGPAGLVG